MIGSLVPWNAAWTSEERYEIRTCRFAGGKKAIWQPHSPGVGKPVFAKPHNVRQRRAIAEMRCTVCGEKTPRDNRWWFKLGQISEGYFMTTESPVHRDCAEHALRVCPYLRGHERDLEPMPSGYSILSALTGGPVFENDFGINISEHEKVIGHLKIAWPAHRIRRIAV